MRSKTHANTLTKDVMTGLVIAVALISFAVVLGITLAPFLVRGYY